MKVLDFETIRKFTMTYPISEMYDWIEDSFLRKKELMMPAKTRINQENGNYYAIMSCLDNKKNVAMCKMIGRHQLKIGEKRSTMMSDILLYEASTGILKGLLDGEYITTLRTGIAAAHATILYAKKDYSELGLIGLGNIMTVYLECLLSKIENKRLKIKLYKHNNQEKRIAERFADKKNISFEFCETYEDTIGNSDVIVSAVTKADTNFCEDKFYKKGCTVIPIMTLGFQNCDLFFDKVYADDIDQIKHFKYFDEFKSICETTDVLNNKMLGRSNDEERILVYYYGLAIHDLYFARKIFDQIKIKETDYRYCNKKYFV